MGDAPTSSSPRSAVRETPEKARVPWPVVRGTVKVMLLMFGVWFFVLPLIPGFRKAWSDLYDLNPVLIGVGFALELAALVSYSLMTRAALPPSHVSLWRLFRIQLSTKSVSNVMPAGSAAGSALGYRLMTLSGIGGSDAGFALATVGLGSAVVLNLVLLVTLMISIPIHGVNDFYGRAALVGILLSAIVALVVVGLVRGQSRAERFVRSFARRLRFDPDRAVIVIRRVVERLRELVLDRKLLARVAVWAVANWLLDAAALWVFLRAFDASLPIDGLIIAFCIANVLAVIPITPGGLGIVETVLIPTLTVFGATRSQAILGVAGYRFAQFWFPMALGGVLYLSLRIGPWSIANRDSLKSLRDVAADATKDDTSGIEWAEQYGRRHDREDTAPSGHVARPPGYGPAS
jgi:putative heme transporter